MSLKHLVFKIRYLDWNRTKRTDSNGALRENRTPTPLREMDFESIASTGSARRAFLCPKMMRYESNSSQLGFEVCEMFGYTTLTKFWPSAFTSACVSSQVFTLRCGYS